MFASDLIKHGGRYFLYIPFIPASWAPEFGDQARIAVIWADAIAGPWSEPIDLGITGFIDPGHAVGEDGRRYLFLSGVSRVPLTEDGLATDGPVEHVYDGWLPRRLGDRGVRPRGTQAAAARRPLLADQRRRRHRRPADRPHGHRGPVPDVRQYLADLGPGTGRLVQIWGYHPDAGWERTSLVVPNAPAGAVRAELPTPLPPIGVAERLVRTADQVTSHDPASGWIHISVGGVGDRLVTFATGCVAELLGASLTGLWLHPELR